MALLPCNLPRMFSLLLKGPAFRLRILAIAILVFATPIMLLKLPWLPVTAQTFIQTVSESTANGTAGYVKDHGERLSRLAVALVLYGLGLLAITGLFGIALGICKHPAAQKIAFVSALIVGAGMPFFDASQIDPATDRLYVVLVIYLPIVVALLSVTALCLSLFRTPDLRVEKS